MKNDERAPVASRDAIAREIYRSLHPGGINRHDSERTRESDAADHDLAYEKWDDGRMGHSHYDEAYKVADAVLALSATAPDAGPSVVDTCTGAGTCTAPLHVHGCYADQDGTGCDDPDDHPAPDAGQREAQERTEVHPMDWRDGLDALDRLLDDCAQGGDDAPQSAVKVWAVREIVCAVRTYEDDTDDSIGRALWEDAVTNGEPWATGDDRG